MTVIETAAVEEPLDPRKEAIEDLRLDVAKLRLEKELAELQPSAPPDLGAQVAALAEIVGQFQRDHNDVVNQLAGLSARVEALEKTRA